MKQRPDIIFIVLDTQRADRLGAYGHQRAVTPNLDRFAAQSALFEQAISPAQWTIPSHASMFTGLYPTAHQVTQSSHRLGTDRPHMVELLRKAGYETVGFCNNPLVGVLDNGFKRGFGAFYNYGGAFPSLPHSSTRLPWPLDRLTSFYSQMLRRISYPIQNFFAHSDLAFRLSLSALFTPLWSRFANFKGQNERSVRDVVRWLAERERKPRLRGERKPLFLFLNLMETHLPFWPPSTYVDQVAPYMRTDPEARATMKRWNREAYRWPTPLEEPLSELEARVLSDMYDAEVAYQDDYLGGLFEQLGQRERSEETLTIIVGDHGDGLGEHGYMGHAFTAYQELVHVPLMVNWPGRIPAGKRIPDPVSTRRVYHTALEAAGPLPENLGAALSASEVKNLTLLETIAGRDPENQEAYAEIYPPLNFVKAIEARQPELLDRFRCRSMRRALVKDDLKLITVDERPDELFDVEQDPEEMSDLLPTTPGPAATLNDRLNRIRSLVDLQRDNISAGEAFDPEADEAMRQHLRSLGYIE